MVETGASPMRRSPGSANVWRTRPAKDAIEIALGGDDFDTAMAERYGWINRAIPDAELDGFVANFVRRILSFDSQALNATKSILNQNGLPRQAELQSTQAIFG